MAAKTKKKATKTKLKAAPKKPSSKKTDKEAADSLLGKKAPSFSMPTDSGETISLAKLRGKNVILYFYPKDNTPGCTTEAQAFSELSKAFSKSNAVIIGVSKDSVESHRKFKDKQGLKFDLASDKDSKVCEAFGVWKMKSLYGRKFLGVERSTFIIDGKGVVRAEWRKVKVAGHAEAVLEALKSL